MSDLISKETLLSNEEKIKTTHVEIIARDISGRPYFELRYFDVSDGRKHIGFGSYDFNNVITWKKDCFEMVAGENDTVVDYDKLFSDLQEACDFENVCNAFRCISLDELEQLNYFLDRLILFRDNNDEDEVEVMEFGDYVLKLAKLADALFLKDVD